jgi:predicted AlkP superfamily pyrophosphatase or phosphodiesterase
MTHAVLGCAVRRIRTLLVALAAVLLLAAAAPPRASAGESRVILISLDGTTPAQVADPALATLARIAREGASAERLVPVFPTNTFPNHVTFVTGVAPERHGIVNNVFVDPERGLHSYANDPAWIEVEPLWSLAARQGVVSAAYHWVGSEGPWRTGFGPRHWKRFQPDTPEAEKVDQILAWLALEDAAERPRLVTAWFRGADHAGHRRGPGSGAAREALRAQDAALGRLVAGLEQRGLLASTTLLVVSDHGMAPARRARRLNAELARAGIRARALGGGGFASLVADSRADAARAVARARELGLEAWLREDAPAELRAGHPRFGAAVVLAPPGTAIVSDGGPGGWAQALLSHVGLAVGGVHGQRPGAPEMGAVFLAFGAGAPAGARLGTPSALDVAPTVLALLGLPVPAWMEGRPLLPAPAAPTVGTR